MSSGNGHARPIQHVIITHINGVLHISLVNVSDSYGVKMIEDALAIARKMVSPVVIPNMVPPKDL